MQDGQHSFRPKSVPNGIICRRDEILLTDETCASASCRRWCTVQQMAFTPCASLKSEILDQAVIDNLNAAVEVYRGRDRLYQLQVDEIAQEKRARHFQKNDTVSQSQDSVLKVFIFSLCLVSFHGITRWIVATRYVLRDHHLVVFCVHLVYGFSRLLVFVGANVLAVVVPVFPVFLSLLVFLSLSVFYSVLFICLSCFPRFFFFSPWAECLRSGMSHDQSINQRAPRLTRVMSEPSLGHNHYHSRSFVPTHRLV